MTGDYLGDSLYKLLSLLNAQWSYPMLPNEVLPNDFLVDLGTDHVAVDHNGTIYARATSRDILLRTAPDAAAYFDAEDLKEFLPILPAPPDLLAPPVPRAPYADPVAPTLEPVKVMPIGDLTDTPKPDWDKETPSNIQPAGTLADLLKANTPSPNLHSAQSLPPATFGNLKAETVKPDSPDSQVSGDVEAGYADQAPTDPHDVYKDPSAPANPGKPKLN